MPGYFLGPVDLPVQPKTVNDQVFTFFLYSWKSETRSYLQVVEFEDEPQTHKWRNNSMR